MFPVYLKLFSLCLFVISLQGCVALAVAPLVGGMSSASNSVVIDPASMSSEVKAVMIAARKMAILSTDSSVSYFADALDKAGKYEVQAFDPPKVSTPSQRRTLAQETCNKQSPDIVLSFTEATSDAGNIKSNAAILLGRAVTEFKSNVEVLRCRDKSRHNFSMAIKINQGTLNTDQAKIAQVIGEESAKAFSVAFPK